MAFPFSGITDLTPGEAHVWSVDLGNPALEGPAFEHLASDERARADRLGLAVERRRFILARAALRSLLGGYLGLAPAAVSLVVGPYGKPSATTPGAPQFNLSHSGDLALIAICRDQAIGVDVEQATPDADLDDIARQFFSAFERTGYFALPAADRLDAFYRIWTRKEAVAKALGLGMSLAGPSFDVTVGACAPRVLSLDGAGEAEAWSLIDLAPAPGYGGALAVSGTVSLVMRRLAIGL